MFAGSATQRPSPPPPTTSGVLLVASPAGIELSRDAGRSFTRVAAVPGVRALAFDFRNWRLAYAATADGTLLRSDDGGRTWDGA